MKYYVVLVTSPNAKTSERLSKGLVEGKLAACVNRVPSITSRYWWKGKIEKAREELLVIKTNQTKLRVLTKWVKANHPYEVCEVLALPIAQGQGDYLKWINGSLRSTKS